MVFFQEEIPDRMDTVDPIFSFTTLDLLFKMISADRESLLTAFWIAFGGSCV